MLRRATHFSAKASPTTFVALRKCLIPILTTSSFPPHCSLQKPPTFSAFHSFFSRLFTPSRPYHSSLIRRHVSPMPGHPQLRLSASYNTEGSYGEGREILVQHLLVKEDNQKLLVELEQRMAGGEDMSDLAVEYSLCPSKEEQGMLGWVRKGQMVPEFEEAAFSAPLNKVVKCKTNFGWHLLQVLSEREESLVKDIQPEEFHAKLQDPGFVEEAQLIDVREPDEVSQASLPGFQVLPLRQIASWGPEITSKFDPMKATYVLCHHGRRSLQVAKWLQTQGFREVFNVSGGIHAYATKVDTSVPTY
ncbi:hypothetical protein V6N13_113740 [Hibiscus sabdariffa]|uniref:Uncharacterized protein n=1 Tax=Hibiscus sabdariffa TaxID=183260 RepID=A0ABR2TZP9_9ROSI